MPTPPPAPAPLAPPALSAADLQAAADRLSPWLPPTPVLTSRSLDRIAGRRLFFKAEPLQRGGSFKIRGALNAVLRLDAAQAARGVLTHSSGNFAQALAIAAGLRGIHAWVVMPEDAPAVKVAAVREYGGEVVFCAPDQRQATADRLREQTGATFLPSYDHLDVIAGQATCGLELLAQVPDLDAVVVPVGGGGLISGVALACLHRAPAVRVWGAEPLGADDAARSKREGRRLPQPDPRTIADGLRTALGVHTWPVVRDHVQGIVTVGEAEIVAAMRLCWERLKLVVEPSGAVSLAACLAADFPAPERAGRVGVVLSGGNVDLGALPF
ncbi:pyridoxal-phosphate dependent enzyme [Myxococcota bacterium]|nr:pyridoxal-phosphate dependent enzyme [Myxococcota bacterium]